MQHRHLGSTDLIVSAVGMGCNKLGSIQARQTRGSAVRLVRQAVDAGITLFDVADAYGNGNSESLLGEALQAAGVDVVVATKVGYRFEERSRAKQAARLVATSIRSRIGHGIGVARGEAYSTHDFSAGYVAGAVRASLVRLRRERIDLLQFHGPPAADRSELPEVIERLIADGLVRHFGVGCESVAVAASWVGVTGLAAIQLPFGVLDPEAAADVLPTARANGVGTIVRGVLGGGVIARFVRGENPGVEPDRVDRLERLRRYSDTLGVELVQLAIWFGAQTAGVDSMLLGMSNSAQLDTGVQLADTPLPSPEVLQRVSEIVRDADAA